MPAEGLRFAPNAAMEYDDPLAPCAGTAFRRLWASCDQGCASPTLMDDEGVLELAESMTELRPLDEELG